MDNLVIANTIRANRKDGITFYSNASGNTVQDNAVIDSARYGIYFKSEGNLITGGNQVSNNAIGVYLKVAHPPEIPQSNQISGNREANVRVDSPAAASP